MDELKMNFKKCTDINLIKKLNVSELFAQDVSRHPSEVNEVSWVSLDSYLFVIIDKIWYFLPKIETEAQGGSSLSNIIPLFEFKNKVNAIRKFTVKEANFKVRRKISMLTFESLPSDPDLNILLDGYLSLERSRVILDDLGQHKFSVEDPLGANTEKIIDPIKEAILPARNSYQLAISNLVAILTIKSLKQTDSRFIDYDEQDFLNDYAGVPILYCLTPLEQSMMEPDPNEDTSGGYVPLFDECSDAEKEVFYPDKQ